MSRTFSGKDLVNASWLAIVIRWDRMQKRRAISKEVYPASTALALQVLLWNSMVDGREYD